MFSALCRYLSNDSCYTAFNIVDVSFISVWKNPKIVITFEGFLPMPSLFLNDLPKCQIKMLLIKKN